MRNFIRWLALKFIRESMGHSHSEDRAAIFAAIDEGFRREFWEDNSQTRLNFAVLLLVKHGKETQPYHFLGKTLNPDAISHAQAAHDAVMEAMKDIPLTEWRKDIMEREKVDVAM